MIGRFQRAARLARGRAAAASGLAALLWACASGPGERATASSGARPAGALATGTSTAAYRATRAAYDVPDVELVTQRGERVSLRALVGDAQPLLLSFIFTSCGSICPTLTATLARAGRELRQDEPSLRLISISIDPENDTPERLQAYAARFDAPPDWVFLTGSALDIERVLKAFDAYRGDKLGHAPLTFVRRNAEGRWLRLDGFTGAGGLVSEYRALAHAP
jgi:protein SCO1/2